MAEAAGERDWEAGDVSYVAAFVRDAPAEAGYDIRTVQELLGHPDSRRR